MADRIVGYERVADGAACPFCVEVDGAFVYSDDPMPLHDGCGCGVFPVTEAEKAIGGRGRRTAGTTARRQTTRTLAREPGPAPPTTPTPVSEIPKPTPTPETVAINEHGELGPVLADPAHEFTGPDDLESPAEHGTVGGMVANPKTAASWPVGTRVVTTPGGMAGEIVRVLAARSGSGAVRVKWDKPRFGEESSVISNPHLNLQKL